MKKDVPAPDTYKIEALRTRTLAAIAIECRARHTTHDLDHCFEVSPDNETVIRLCDYILAKISKP